MSLRWIHENLEPPTVDEECSDIDDSCSDDSYDSDLSLYDHVTGNGNDGDRRKKRETRRHPTTTVTFDENQKPHYVTSNNYKHAPCVIWDPRLPAENPIYNSPVKLFCRTGYHLTIARTGQVRGLSGTDEAHYALLHITPVSFGVIRIQSVETGLYLAFNKKGHLYGEPKMERDSTEWEQWSIGSYDAFRSRKFAHNGWWIGIKKNGRTKAGAKTAWGQKAIQFLAIREDRVDGNV